MPAILLRSDWDATRVRNAARLAEEADQVRRLLAIAAVCDGISRAARYRGISGQNSELNPAENLWKFLCQTFLSNRVFETYDAISTPLATPNAVLDTPWCIMSIGLGDWARTGQCQGRPVLD